MNTRLKAMSHRGRGSGIRENTIPAFLSAIEAGFEWVEFDIRRTLDGVLVVFNDEELDGLSLDVMSFNELNSRAVRQGFEIPTLEETLKTLKGKIKLSIEFKEPHYGMEALILILQYFNRDDFIITSSDYDFIHDMSRKGQQVRLGLILGSGETKGTPLSLIMDTLNMDKLVLSGADTLVVERRLLRWNFLQRAASRRFKVFVSTVNSKEDFYELAKDSRVEAIRTDVVHW